MNNRTLLSVLFLACGSFAVYGFGTIEMTSPDPVTETYSAHIGVEVSRSVELSVGGGAINLDRSYRIGFSGGSSGDPQNRTLLGTEAAIPYEILDNITDQNVLGDLDGGGSLSTGTIPAGESAVEAFVVRVAPDQLPKAGTYLDDVTISAYDNQDRVQSQATLSVILEVGPQLTLTLSTNNLGLGELIEGATGDVSIFVEANAPYGIELSSPYHDWRMAHDDDTVASYVPYSLRLDSQELSRSQNPVFVSGFPQTAVQGREHRLEVVVGNTDSATSGPHSDVIDITVTANQ